MATKKNIYNQLLVSVDNVYQTKETTQKEQIKLDTFVNFLSKHQTEISKFETVSKNLCLFLDKVDFQSELKFDEIQQKLQSLIEFRVRLVNMATLAQSMNAYPNRHKVKEAIDKCKNLLVVCSQRMNLNELNKVSQLVDDNTKKLQEIQVLFEYEATIKQQIDAIIVDNATLLKPFKGCQAELIQYVKDYPHQGQNDLSIVKDRIEQVKCLQMQKKEVDKAVQEIKTYCNRYNKELVIQQFLDVEKFMGHSMRFADIPRVTTQLNDIKKQTKTIVETFKNELQELKNIKSLLESCQCEFWKDNSEPLLANVNQLLKQDTKRIDFNWSTLKTQCEQYRNKRIKDIDSVIKKYQWLENKEKYKNKHIELLNKYITYEEYMLNINKIKTRRIISLVCIPIFGWIILFRDCMNNNKNK